jgi:hypothetical protein
VSDFETKTLRGKARKAAEIILNAAGPVSGGGCKAFYSQKEWRDRGEEYGRKAVLIVVHDGGDLAPFFSWSYGQEEKQAAMRAALGKEKMWAEACTGWYTAIYERTR